MVAQTFHRQHCEVRGACALKIHSKSRHSMMPTLDAHSSLCNCVRRVSTFIAVLRFQPVSPSEDPRCASPTQTSGGGGPRSQP